jgi:hypothetical protein
MALDKKQLKLEGSVEGLIKIGLEGRLPLIAREEKVHKELID